MLLTGSSLLLRRGAAALTVVTLAGATLTGPALAFAPEQDDTFFRAYFLEHEVGDLESALELYRAAAADKSLSREDRARAARHAQACAEELAVSDMATLVPEDTIFYLELNEPGGQLGKLLDQLGLLQGHDTAGTIGISPHLLAGTLGLRGAAIAVTRIDPTGGMPGGVMILHPGDMEAVRGLIETALPAGGEPVDAIAGNPTYSVEGMAFVTMTDRLILASTERGLIADVLDRVGGDGSDSLAAHPDLEQTMALRGDDLAFFCFNAEPVMPLAQTMLGALAQQDPQAAMAMGLMDVESFQAAAGRLGVDDDGMSIDMSLQLAEGHRNVVFNLTRMPQVNEHTFHLIPEGVAFFLASTLNSEVEGSAGITDGQGRPVVTIMDIGREVFGNLRDVAIFSLPSLSEGPYGEPMPDMAIAMSVNDAERSKAIWELMLGVAKGASGNGDTSPGRQKVGDVRVDRYDVQGVSVYLYAAGDRIVISPSVRAIEAAVGAAKGNSVAGDPAFAGLVAKASNDSTSVLGIAVGRCAEMARPMIPQRELQQMGPILDLMANMTVTAMTRHSDTELAWSARVTGLPNVGPMVDQLVRAQMRGGGMGRQVAWSNPSTEQEAHRARSLAFAAEDAAFEAEVASLRAKQEGLEAMQEAFEELAQSGKHDKAKELVPAIAELIGDDANGLNDFAWNVISGPAGEHYAKAVLPISKKSNQLTDGQNWYYLDTLAHVEFALGHKKMAVAIQEKAVEIASKSGDSRVEEAVASLTKFKGIN